MDRLFQSREHKVIKHRRNRKQLYMNDLILSRLYINKMSQREQLFLRDQHACYNHITIIFVTSKNTSHHQKRYIIIYIYIYISHKMSSSRSLALSTHSPPVHVPSHCFPPVLIQICPVLERFLPPCSFDRNRQFSYPLFVQNMNEHKTVSCALSSSCTNPLRIAFRFDSTTLSSLRLLLNVCTCTDPHVPPTKMISLTVHPALSFCLLCYCFKAFD
jgi:hypothetical protein